MTVLLQLTLVAAVPAAADSEYATAYHDSQKTGKPMLIMVGAKWCSACQAMKSSLIPKLKRRGELDGVVFARLDYDTQGKLAKQVMSGRTLPQLILYYRSDDGWQRKHLTGGQSLAAVEALLSNGKKAARVASLEKENESM